MHAWGAVDLRIYLAQKNHGHSLSAQSYDFFPHLRKLDILDFTLSPMYFERTSPAPTVHCAFKEVSTHVGLFHTFWLITGFGSKDTFSESAYYKKKK